MNVVVYRTCDRPVYTQHTWPRLVEATSPEPWIVVVENSDNSENTERNLRTVYGTPRERVLVHTAGERLGVVTPILLGLDVFRSEHGDPDVVMVCDDDRLMPDGWDTRLVAMLDSGEWDVVGIGRWARVEKTAVEGEGDAAGHRWPCMAGAGAAFRHKLLVEHPMQGNRRETFNSWSGPFDCAFAAGLYAEEIDKYDDAGLKLGLRKTDYREYSRWVR